METAAPDGGTAAFGSTSNIRRHYTTAFPPPRQEPPPPDLQAFIAGLAESNRLSMVDAMPEWLVLMTDGYLNQIAPDEAARLGFTLPTFWKLVRAKRWLFSLATLDD